MIRILVHEWVTGGGLAGSDLPEGLAAEGRAMREAVVRDFRAVEGVEVVVTLDARFAERGAVRVGPGEEREVFRDLAARCDHTVLIAPETGGVLADRARLIAHGSLGPTAEAIESTADKLALARHLTRLGIRTPRTVRYEGVLPIEPPAVVKPVDGAGSEDTYLVTGRGEPLPAFDRPMIAQEYCPGEPMSASFLISEGGEANLLAVGWQVVTTRGQRFHYDGGRLPGPRERGLGEALRAVSAVPGLRGFVGVDFVWDDGADVIEINPRVTTSYVGLSHDFGPGTIARAWLGRGEVVTDLARERRTVRFRPDGSIRAPHMNSFPPCEGGIEGGLHSSRPGPEETPSDSPFGGGRVLVEHVEKGMASGTGTGSGRTRAVPVPLPEAAPPEKGDRHRPSTARASPPFQAPPTFPARSYSATAWRPTMADALQWLALDIGGANVKAAHSSGAGVSVRFPVWKRPDDLPAVIAEIAGGFEAFDRVALTMTAELCDCFATKREGVGRVLDAVTSAVDGRPVRVFGVDGRFHPVATARERPMLVAASNWVALATVAARETGSGILIDIGSTTSDLIPLLDGSMAARGRTDTERLATGELVYAGVRRTPLCALADRLPFRGRPTRLAAELFATTLDVYLTLGDVPEDPDDSETADGRPATIDRARDRLARMVGADREGFDGDDALRLATAADEALTGRLVGAVAGRPETAIVAGSGEFLARRVAERVVVTGGKVIGLSDLWGSGPSVWACAHALLLLAREDDGA